MNDDKALIFVDYSVFLVVFLGFQTTSSFEKAFNFVDFSLFHEMCLGFHNEKKSVTMMG